MNTIRKGSTGEAVSYWQQILISDGATITADGVFGSATEAATKAWQAKRKLLVDGIVGSNTWSQAMSELANDLDHAVNPPTAKSAAVFVGARIVDSYPFSLGGTAAQAKALRAREVDGLAGYLGVMNKARLDYVLDAGLGFIGVTLANRFDGAAAVAQARKLGLPAGTTLALDIEGKSIYDLGAALIPKCADWRKVVAAAGFKTMLYVGSPQPLTSKELGDLAFDGYWNALSREADRFGNLAEPACGWNMWQMIPQHHWKDTGVFVDVNIVGQDFRTRVPSWAVRA